MSRECKHVTEQEQFWAGEFGSEYISRNNDASIVQCNQLLFSKIFKRPMSSLIEFGANIGLNLKALQSLFPQADLAAIEINAHAAAKLKEQNFEVFQESILEFEIKRQYEVTLSKGVLIHINPDYLPEVYDTLYNVSSRYICLVEYYNPVPVEVSYRGHEARLFKRDFAGEMLERFSDLTLADYGFAYRHDPVAPQGDLTWFLLEKSR